jgi:hypothetical protein
MIVEIYPYGKDPAKDGDTPPVGALFLRAIDIVNYQIKYSATRIDASFTIAPVGKAHLTIY